MKRYHILDLKSDSCKVVVATSYVSPLSQVYAIALELKSIGYQGDVYGIQTENMESVGNIFEHGEQYGFTKEAIKMFTPSLPV